MTEPRILVIGEKFIDRYFVGTATRLSPEAPIPVVAVKEVIQSEGGAANVAANLRALGAHIREIYQPTPYPTKNRLVGNSLQLARWDEHDTASEIDFLQLGCYDKLDGIVISDYGKGGFNMKNTPILEKLATSVPYVFVDTKQSPDCFQFRLPTETFYFPNMKEWTAHQNTYGRQWGVIRTESEQGMSHIAQGALRNYKSAIATNIVSVCGAGDTAIAAFAYAYCKKPDTNEAMEFASKACAVVVGKPYTSVASHEEINKITT